MFAVYGQYVYAHGMNSPIHNKLFPAAAAERWLSALIAERGLSRNTVAAYHQDLSTFAAFLEELGQPLENVDDETAMLFIAWLRSRGDINRTLARRISCLRNFFTWCVDEGLLAANPIALIETPKLPFLLPNVLSKEEMFTLLATPKSTTLLGRRDRVMLELLYATGIRVSELITLQPLDLDLQSGVVRVFGKGSKERYVPLHNAAVTGMITYLRDVRPLFHPLCYIGRH